MLIEAPPPICTEASPSPQDVALGSFPTWQPGMRLEHHLSLLCGRSLIGGNFPTEHTCLLQPITQCDQKALSCSVGDTLSLSLSLSLEHIRTPPALSSTD